MWRQIGGEDDLFASTCTSIRPSTGHSPDVRGSSEKYAAAMGAVGSGSPKVVKLESGGRPQEMRQEPSMELES